MTTAEKLRRTAQTTVPIRFARVIHREEDEFFVVLSGEVRVQLEMI
ncbi:MAG: hypothetical protein WD651_01340 [Acidimicrobiia bacterium]